MIEDAELTGRVRDGDERAVEELYRRHHAAVLAFAGRLCRQPQTAEDLASEAFARTLRTVRSGTGGPTGGWRPYLYAVARNTAMAWSQADGRAVLTAEFEDLPGGDELEPASEEAALVVEAYESLPERWKTVLWHTLIENESPDRVAGLLGTTANNVNVLAFRAREGLRRAFLTAHAARASAPECRTYADHLAKAVRKPGARRPRALQQHLDVCPSCARTHAGLLDLNTTLRASLPMALFLPQSSAAPVVAVKTTAAMGLTAKLTLAGGALAATGAVTAGLIIGAGEPTKAPPPAASTVRPAATQSLPVPELQPKQALDGIRIRKSGAACVGVTGRAAVPLPCADPRTAWRRDGGEHFRLVHAASDRCLVVAEHYNRTSFNGGGIHALRTGPCSTAGTWSTPRFSDGVPRLIDDATRAALSIGKSFGGTPNPTAYILYGPYTDSEDQHFTLS
ncbi:sigma-70 family RNA polymerase sigma factor [Actinocorallia populi]|uniref:sigma-70 family RNA polymerase sigma factor n=1 Tax=Actinocorallia populi TaxID=2079200 RepID=UPI000D08C2EA|nr:sigma-70 family RNA polymerase sigma factor [Actinocorallia populi]